MPPKTRAPKPAVKRTTTRKTAAAPAKRQPGRPRKLEIEPGILQTIVDTIKLGVHPERAAVAAGISERTHYLWQAKGLEEQGHRDAGKPPRKTYQVFLDYVSAVDKATALAEIDLLKKARSGENHDALAILERRFRDRWGSKPIAPTAATKTGPAATTPLGQLEERRRAREQASR